MKRRYLRRIELAMLAVGLLLIAVFVAAHIHRAVLSRSAINSLEAANRSVTKDVPSLWSKTLALDTNLWSSVRIAAYEHSLASHFDPPLAILRIPKVGLEVAVLYGTDDLTLNRGVGVIEGTSRPGEGGKIGIAGHRDGFFRVLKDIHRGDTIDLETRYQIQRYRIDEIVIVSPHDVSVLRPTSAPTLTLVTCYPFYFIGSAPQRYIVMASLDRSMPVSDQPEQSGNTTAAHFESVSKDSSPPSQESIKERTQ